MKKYAGSICRDLFNLMGGTGRELGTAHKHELYDILQEAVIRANPGVTLAFRDGKILSNHKTLSEIGQGFPPSPRFKMSIMSRHLELAYFFTWPPQTRFHLSLLFM